MQTTPVAATNLSEYEYLKDTVHTDPEDLMIYKVTDVRLSEGEVVVDRVLWPGPEDGNLTVSARDAQNFRDFGEKPTLTVAAKRLPQVQKVAIPPKRSPKKARTEGVQLQETERVTATTAAAAQAPIDTPGCTSTITNDSVKFRDSRPKVRAQRAPIPAKVAPAPRSVNSNYGLRSTGRMIELNNLTLLEPNSGQTSNNEADYVVPKTHAQVLLSSRMKDWLKAEADEWKALVDTGCVEEAQVKPGKPPLPIKWVYSLKTDSAGAIQRFKARAVARGDKAVEGEDFFESFAPVVRWGSIRIYIALTVLLGLVPLQLDVDTAYLYAALLEEIYALPPDGIHLPKGRCFRLKKSLYGLPQSGRNWNKLLDKVLSDWSFIRLSEDYCLYYRQEGGIITLLFIYVDDLYVSSSTQASLEMFVTYLSGHFKLKLLGVPHHLLGITMSWGEGFKTVHLNASKLINKLLKEFWTEADGFKEVPMDPRLRLKAEDQLKDSNEVRLTKEDKQMQKRYRTITGTLIFLVNTCRVDMAFASMILCRSMAFPGWKHWDAARWTLCYLAKHRDLGISYLQEGNLRPYGYCDADHGSDWSRRSIGGYIFFLAGGPISWQSKLMGEVCLSTAESETRAIDAAFNAIREAAWLTKVFEELGHPLLGSEPFDRIELRTTQDFSNFNPVIIFEDNQATIKYAANPTAHTLMKHLDRHLCWIRQQVERNTIRLIYLETVLQLADLFTKPLEPGQFWTLISKFMNTLDEFLSFFY